MAVVTVTPGQPDGSPFAAVSTPSAQLFAVPVVGLNVDGWHVPVGSDALTVTGNVGLWPRCPGSAATSMLRMRTCEGVPDAGPLPGRVVAPEHLVVRSRGRHQETQESQQAYQQ